MSNEDQFRFLTLLLVDVFFWIDGHSLAGGKDLKCFRIVSSVGDYPFEKCHIFLLTHFWVKPCVNGANLFVPVLLYIVVEGSFCFSMVSLYLLRCCADVVCWLSPGGNKKKRVCFLWNCGSVLIQQDVCFMDGGKKWDLWCIVLSTFVGTCIHKPSSD